MQQMPIKYIVPDLSKEFTKFAENYFDYYAKMTDCEHNDIELPAEMYKIPNLGGEYETALKAGGQDKLYYFNANHLGSGSLITDRNGQTYQTLAYAPYGEEIVNKKQYNDWFDEWRRFGGHHFDEESGLLQAEARYYSPPLSIPISTDPHWYNYPHITSYNWCGNNLIMVADPTGMDGEITGEGTKDNPYVINANYYYNKGELNDEQKTGLNAAINEYNDRGAIKTKSGYVQFNLSAQEVDDKGLSRMGDENKNLYSGDDFFSKGNIVSINNNSDVDNSHLGSGNSLGITINMDKINSFVGNGDFKAELIQSTFFHEIGHNLGLDDTDNTMMMMPALKSANGSYLINKSYFNKSGVNIMMKTANQGERRISDGVRLGFLKYRR